MIRHGNPQVYVYRFAFMGAYNFYKRFTKYEGHAVSHGDEMGYLFSGPYPTYYIQQKRRYDRENYLKYRMVKMWTNFAKSGSPNVGEPGEPETSVYWPPVGGQNETCHLDINDKFRVVEGLPYQSRIRFWEEIYRKYG